MCYQFSFVILKLIQFNVFQIQFYYNTNNSKRTDIYKAHKNNQFTADS